MSAWDVWTGLCVLVGYLVLVGLGLSLFVLAVLWVARVVPWRKAALFLGLADDIEWGARCPACNTYVEWGHIKVDAERIRRWTCPGCSARVQRESPEAEWVTT